MMKVRVAKGSVALRSTASSVSVRSDYQPRRLPQKPQSARSFAFQAKTAVVFPVLPRTLCKQYFHSSSRIQEEIASSSSKASESTSTTPSEPVIAEHSVNTTNTTVNIVHLNETNSASVQTSAHAESEATVAAAPTPLTAQTASADNTANNHVPVHTSTPEVATAYFSHGQALLQAGQLAPALKSLKAAIKYQPKHVGAHYMAGMVYGKADKHKTAIKYFLRAIELGEVTDKTVQDAYYQLGQSYIALGKYPEAVQAMDKMIRVNSEDKLVHYNRGYALMMLEIYDYSIMCFDVVLKMDPSHLASLQCKAFSLIMQRKYEKALSILDDVAMKIDPNDAVTLSYRKFALKKYFRQNGVYSFDEVFPSTTEKKQQLPARFRRSLALDILLD